MDRIAADIESLVGAVHRDRLGQADHARLRRRIGDIGYRQIRSRRRRINNRAARNTGVIAHQRYGRLAAQHHAQKVNAHELLPGINRDGGDIQTSHDTSVIHKNIEPSLVIPNLLLKQLPAISRTDIQQREISAALSRYARSIGLIDVGNADFGILSAETPDHPLADTRGTSCDHCDLFL